MVRRARRPGGGRERAIPTRGAGPEGPAPAFTACSCAQPWTTSPVTGQVFWPSERSALEAEHSLFAPPEEHSLLDAQAAASASEHSPAPAQHSLAGAAAELASSTWVESLEAHAKQVAARARPMISFFMFFSCVAGRYGCAGLWFNSPAGPDQLLESRFWNPNPAGAAPGGCQKTPGDHRPGFSKLRMLRPRVVANSSKTIVKGDSRDERPI